MTHEKVCKCLVRSFSALQEGLSLNSFGPLCPLVIVYERIVKTSEPSWCGSGVTPVMGTTPKITVHMRHFLEIRVGRKRWRTLFLPMERKDKESSVCRQEKEVNEKGYSGGSSTRLQGTKSLRGRQRRPATLPRRLAHRRESWKFLGRQFISECFRDFTFFWCEERKTEGTRRGGQ